MKVAIYSRFIEYEQQNNVQRLFDELIRQLDAGPGAVMTVILELELAGRCVRHPGNRVSWA